MGFGILNTGAQMTFIPGGAQRGLYLKKKGNEVTSELFEPHLWLSDFLIPFQSTFQSLSLHPVSISELPSPPSAHPPLSAHDPSIHLP